MNAEPATTYLDHAATTPMLPEAVAVMAEALTRTGNASSLHSAGRRSRRLVEESRERIAAAVGARPSEVVLTTGGTESDNLAVKGLYWARRAADPRRTRVLVSEIEHHAVLESVEWLAEHEGAEVIRLPVDRQGRVQPATLRAALAEAPDRAAVVSVMWANNEVGTVNPIRELVEVAHEHGVPLHTDAVQAVGILPVDFAACGADALTLTGHKLGGPYGAGALLLRREAALTAAAARRRAGARRPLRHVRRARDRRARHGRRDRRRRRPAPGRDARRPARRPRRQGAGHRAGRPAERRPRHGTVDGGPSRLPGNAHLSFPGCEGDSLLMLLDAHGIECSTGSACTAGVAQPSHVLLAMGADEAAARGSLRFSFGHTSTSDDVEAVAAVIGAVVERARRAGQPQAIR